MNNSQNTFIKFITKPLRFRLYLLYKLPVAFCSGIKLEKVNSEASTVSVPFKWLTQNPFNSTYFASLAMAAEMSTGILAMSNVYKRKPRVSMLVTKMEASYFKKANDKIYFVCEQGNEITQAINSAVDTGESKSIIVNSVGKNKDNIVVAEFLFTWSFKVKSLHDKTNLG